MKIEIKTGRGAAAIVEALDDSYRMVELMGEDVVYLHFKSTGYENKITSGCWIEYNGNRYYLFNHPEITKISEREYDYTAYFYSVAYTVNNILFKDVATGTTTPTPTFSLTGKLRLFAEFIVANLNAISDGWTIVSVDETEEHSMSFDGVTCKDALKSICEEFEVEYYISPNKELSMVANYGKNELQRPPILSYGLDESFTSGVNRKNIQNCSNITRLYIKGSEQNIVESVYGNKTLLLPNNKTIYIDGKTYKADEHGTYIRRADIANTTIKEELLDCTQFYPKRVGTVTQWIERDAEEHFYDFIDDTIPNTLNYKEQLIEGQSMSVTFQTGMLAGKTFEVSQYYHDNTVYNKKRYFELVPQEIDGIKMPSDVFKAVEGDKYVVLGIALPDAYIREDGTQTGASWEMFRYAAHYLSDREDDKFEYMGSLNKNWLNRNTEIDQKLSVGDNVYIWDQGMQREKIKSRVKSRKVFLNDPLKQEIQINNAVQSRSRLRKMLERLGSSTSAKNTLISNVNNITNITSGVSSEQIEEMIASRFSDAQVQFIYTNPIWYFAISDDPFEYLPSVGGDPKTKTVHFSVASIRHETLFQENFTPFNTIQSKRKWRITSEQSIDVNTAKNYSIYIKAEKDPTQEINGIQYGNASYIVSETTKGLEEGDYYYFLVANLKASAEDTQHTIIKRYGVVTIPKPLMEVDNIKSADGATEIDLRTGAIRVTSETGDIEIKSTDGMPAMSVSGSASIVSQGNTYTTRINSENIQIQRTDGLGDSGIQISLNDKGQINMRLNGDGANALKLILSGLPTNNQLSSLETGQIYKYGAQLRIK